MSSERLNKRACRVSATLNAALLTLFFFTHWWLVLAFIVLEYVVRIFTNKTAPIGFVANGILRVLHISPVLMDKAPKVFAWRAGFLMAVASAAVLPYSITASAYIALALAVFNILDGICNFCVGCIIYTYFILPRVRPATSTAPA
jgi:hypothetical protein